LFVKPEHQRKGLGGRLVQWGIDLANEKGLSVYVESTEEGQGLYEKFGIKVVERVDVDLSLWGGNPGEWDRYACMYKPFKPAEE
jgi:GNAT superfamily N-acetyltransferase